MSRPARSAVAPLLLLLGIGAGCGGSSTMSPMPSKAALLDPASCQACHPSAYQQWSGSMHAYASDDPLFIAMNKRGQRETNGALGNFCVKCHAPVALREGQTTDGTNLAQVDRPYKGVTCYFCHSIAEVNGAHDDPLTLATDGVLQGPITDPVANPFHQSRYTKLLDSSHTEATDACGSCHDIVNPKGTAIERTFSEWKQTVFANVQGGLGCADCHMNGSDGMAAAGSTRTRKIHDHSMAGIDVALTPWPNMDQQKQAIMDLMAPAVQGTLCLDERSNRIAVILDNAAAGHMWPSGAASDRRVWIEVTAYSAGQVIYQSGVVPAGSYVETLNDPDLWLIRDCFFDETQTNVHMFWQAASYTTNLLPGSPVLMPGMLRGHLRWDLPRPDSTRTLSAVPDRITMKVHLRAVGEDVLKDLEMSGDLDPALEAGVPTYDVPGGTVEWTADTVNFTWVDNGSRVTCVAPPVFSSNTIPTITQATCDPHPVAPGARTM